MFGSGVKIFMIRKCMGPIGYSVEVVGMMRNAVVWPPIEDGAIRRIGLMILGFGL
jgi:hypothetical protein